jgi:hypothetical protein
MAKPILVVKVPISFSAEKSYEIGQLLNNKINDYHIFIIPNSIDEFEFKVFNGEYSDEEFKKIELFIEELKK